MYANLPRKNNSDPKTFLWISPFDDRNLPADPLFVEAAYRIGGGFLFYRARELNDGGRAIELVERAVHLASRARKSKAVAEPSAYLFRTFTNLVDAEIERQRRLLPLNEEILHEVSGREGAAVAREVEREVDWRLILDSMDKTLRLVYDWLRQGRKIGEIALDLGIKPNTLVQRVHRARRQIQEHLDRQRRNGGTSRGDGEEQAGRSDARRDLPAHGGSRPHRVSEPGPRRLSARGDA